MTGPVEERPDIADRGVKLALEQEVAAVDQVDLGPVRVGGESAGPVRSDGLRRRAFQLRQNVSAYDAAYIALAETLDCSLLTKDSRLRKSAGHHARIVVL